MSNAKIVCVALRSRILYRLKQAPIVNINTITRRQYCLSRNTAPETESQIQDHSQKVTQSSEEYFCDLLHKLHPKLKHANPVSEKTESDLHNLNLESISREENVCKEVIVEKTPKKTKKKRGKIPASNKQSAEREVGNNDSKLQNSASNFHTSNIGVNASKIEDVGHVSKHFVEEISEIDIAVPDSKPHSNDLQHFSNLKVNATECDIRSDSANEIILPLEIEDLDCPPHLSNIMESSSEDTDDDVDDTPSALSLRTPEFIDSLGPGLMPTFNFAAYVNHSESLQQLVKLGVDLSRIEKKQGALELYLQLDFEKDMKGHIQFLHDVGVPAEELGRYLTKNPLIFKESLDDLQVRISYLKSKKFCKDAISRIVCKAPYFLSFTTVQIDKRLGFFQQMFSLSGREVRELVTKMPKVVISGINHIREMTFVIKETMGFTRQETKMLLLAKPKLWMLQRQNLEKRFDLIHNKIGISHKQLLEFPGVLFKREFLVRQRHLYLEKLQRAQYDPAKPGYVSLKDLVTGTDAEFCANIAKTTVEDFNTFLKTL